MITQVYVFDMDSERIKAAVATDGQTARYFVANPGVDPSGVKGVEESMTRRLASGRAPRESTPIEVIAHDLYALVSDEFKFASYEAAEAAAQELFDRGAIAEEFAHLEASQGQDSRAREMTAQCVVLKASFAPDHVDELEPPLTFTIRPTGSGESLQWSVSRQFLDLLDEAASQAEDVSVVCEVLRAGDLQLYEAWVGLDIGAGATEIIEESVRRWLAATEYLDDEPDPIPSPQERFRELLIQLTLSELTRAAIQGGQVAFSRSHDSKPTEWTWSSPVRWCTNWLGS